MGPSKFFLSGVIHSVLTQAPSGPPSSLRNMGCTAGSSLRKQVALGAQGAQAGQALEPSSFGKSERLPGPGDTWTWPTENRGMRILDKDTVHGSASCLLF